MPTIIFKVFYPSFQKWKWVYGKWYLNRELPDKNKVANIVKVCLYLELTFCKKLCFSHMTKQHPIFMASTKKEFFLDSLARQSMDIKCHLSGQIWRILISEKEGKLTQVWLRKFSSHNHFLHSEFSFIARSAIWYHDSFKAPDEI